METIAERQLVLKSGDNALQVIVRLGAPVRDESGLDWKCPFEIECGSDLRSMAIHGVDSMQALQLTICTLDGELELLARRMKGELCFQDGPFHSILEHGGLMKAPPPPPFDFSSGNDQT